MVHDLEMDYSGIENENTIALFRPEEYLFV